MALLARNVGAKRWSSERDIESIEAIELEDLGKFDKQGRRWAQSGGQTDSIQLEILPKQAWSGIKSTQRRAKLYAKQADNQSQK